MAEKRHKREATSPIKLDLAEDSGFILEPAKIEIGSGYAVSLSYDEEGNPVVDVKTYGDVDLSKIRRDIERLCPDAKIRQLNQEPTVTVVRKRKSKRKR
ncbi:hypothetical protein KEJ32_01565 [Candidatus Bathyarchaeota archaeon]|nr:hypothetical protein [Candidatus Bathyarchaeota archaeon]MBS7637166.1 hypothetical protein [Candidatus Bathyarchaeota archaeon]